MSTLPPLNATNAPRRGLHQVARAALARWNDVEGFRLGAAFSFYAIFSIFPLLLVSVTIVGFIVGSDHSARTRLLSAVSSPHSPVRELLNETLAAMQANHRERGLSAVIGLGALLVSASGAAVELHFAINRIWGVPPRRRHGIGGILHAFLLERLAGFAMIGGVAVTLLASLVVSAMMGIVVRSAHAAEVLHAARWTERLVSFALISGVVSATFHLVPRTRPRFLRVVPGGVLTAALLAMLKTSFSIYLAKVPTFSAYGIVGSVLALVTWIYVSTLVLLAGATVSCAMSEPAAQAAPSPSQFPPAAEAESQEEAPRS